MQIHAWHVSPQRNLASILEKGIEPRLPEPDGDLAVSFFITRAVALEKAAQWTKWRGVPLCLLRVNITGIAVTETFSFERITTSLNPVEASRILSAEIM